ncbi:MAG: type II 3-dehydroquinate dehydratase [Alphaproteobacteria bacterium]|nr:type II 3-dehydroquinate dehydratase [Alphaproteobacteria bacterium]
MFILPNLVLCFIFKYSLIYFIKRVKKHENFTFKRTKRDALLSVQIPFVEVHMTNIYARESFRHKSLLSDIAVGVVAGFHKKVIFWRLMA